MDQPSHNVLPDGVCPILSLDGIEIHRDAATWEGGTIQFPDVLPHSALIPDSLMSGRHLSIWALRQ
jgi:hypothetical protein